MLVKCRIFEKIITDRNHPCETQLQSTMTFKKSISIPTIRQLTTCTTQIIQTYAELYRIALEKKTVKPLKELLRFFRSKTQQLKQLYR